MLVNIDNENFKKEVLECDKPVFIDFSAVWCGPCQKLSPIIDELANVYSEKIKIGKIDIDKCMELAQEYKISAVPTMLIFKNGEVVDTLSGLMSKKALEEKFQEIV